MSNTADAAPSPSLLARVVAHLMVGLVVVAITKAIFRQKLALALVAGIIAVVAHRNLDAPIARRLSDLGI